MTDKTKSNFKPRRAYNNRRRVVVATETTESEIIGVETADQANLLTDSEENVIGTDVQSSNSVNPVENAGMKINAPAATRKCFTEVEEDLIIEFYGRNRFLWDQNDSNYKIAVKSASLQNLVGQLNNKFSGISTLHVVKHLLEFFDLFLQPKKFTTDSAVCEQHTKRTLAKLKTLSALVLVPTMFTFQPGYTLTV